MDDITLENLCQNKSPIKSQAVTFFMKLNSAQICTGMPLRRRYSRQMRRISWTTSGVKNNSRNSRHAFVADGIFSVNPLTAKVLGHFSIDFR